ncbi:MAG: RNA methyltransferase [Bacteroidales bacterium]|nr:RNA methyltransferase [Bacteroidales bacterium]
MITSKSNPKIKNIIKLQKASERISQGLFVVEGFREIHRAIRSGFQVMELYQYEGLTNAGQLDAIFGSLPSFNGLQTVTKDVFEKVAYREGSDGLIAVFSSKNTSLPELKLSKNPLVIVLEAVEKPGNLGAVLRTADAAGVDAVILCNSLTDLYNPNTIRASLGCIFSVQITTTTTEKAIEWLHEHDISIFCTYLEASVDYRTIDYTKPTAIVMGAESTGLTIPWVKNANQNILISMRGIADSLNVSVSSAIVVFEALRQRNC